jgi:hypothetical protein
MSEPVPVRRRVLCKQGVRGSSPLSSNRRFSPSAILKVGLTSVAALGFPAEQIVEPGQGLAADLLLNVRKDLHRGCDVGMAEDHLRIARRHPELVEQRGSRVMQVMQLNQPDLRTRQQAQPEDQVDVLIPELPK